MLKFLDPLRDIDFLGVLIRMIGACLCGAVVGLERSAKNRPAGFRTHILVCMGAAVAAMTGAYLFVGLKLPADISRISSQVISGLGFIGAGTIIVTRKLTIKGLTTAAGLWTTGIVGLAAGSGYYELALLGTALILLCETAFGKVASKIREDPQFLVEILYNEKNSLDSVLRFCKDERMSIVNLKIHTLEDDEADYAAQVTLRGNLSQAEALKRIRVMPGIVAVVGI